MSKKEAMGYSSIQSADDENGLNDGAVVSAADDRRVKAAVLSVAAVAVFSAAFALGGYRASAASPPPSGSDFGVGSAAVLSPPPVAGPPSLPMPHGVNLGSWLSLEDYFYVGRTGAVEVATSNGVTAGMCLPPLHTGPSTGPMWNAETDLYANLAEAKSVAESIKTFHAFRVSYLDFDDELPRIAALGIGRVRVPMSWCLTDHDPENDALLAEALEDDETDPDRDAELERRYTCLDPFFADEGIDVKWPAIPRPFVERFLRACGRHGVKATLDVHTYPGGTSLGTFSGVWPRAPLFWRYDADADAKEGDDFGRRTYRELLGWLESLAASDAEAFDGLGAVTPMNEPAHLAGLFGGGGPFPEEDSFLPPLPGGVAEKFLADINGEGSRNDDGGAPYVPVPVPDGHHLRVLLWLSDAVETFRSSSLPAKGIEIHVNVHESILTRDLVPDDADDIGAQSAAILASWWRGTTTTVERSSWAVLDMHHYHAWDPACQGASDGPPSGNYTCGDGAATAATLGRCASWAGVYRSAVSGSPPDAGGIPPGARLASAEFSASTHHSVLHSCVDVTTLRSTYLAQVEAANDADVELYWWSWKMPHGGAFRRAWSFKHFLYLMGVEGFDHPDESEITCGD
uniref:Glycoside hydrolase family 5 domain-containing protein n=1 Tax=Odontella aurita TaxID=265563 RepID=A0A7S4HVV1_9STRA|mmetsp:Transcript_15903/g.45730  ORF Transcript_15903/g.45730 Transcript_15903/m.45730 type:complete len:629 (+) Transcript_15903:168-2054(+)